MWKVKAKQKLEFIVTLINDGRSIEEVAQHCEELDNQLRRENLFKQTDIGEPVTMMNTQVIEVQMSVKAIVDAVRLLDKRGSLVAANGAFAILGR